LLSTEKASLKTGFWQGLFVLQCKSERHGKTAVVTFKGCRSFFVFLWHVRLKFNFSKEKSYETQKSFVIATEYGNDILHFAIFGKCINATVGQWRSDRH
jgi:hypothetical protein